MFLELKSVPSPAEQWPYGKGLALWNRSVLLDRTHLKVNPNLANIFYPENVKQSVIQASSYHMECGTDKLSFNHKSFMYAFILTLNTFCFVILFSR